MRGGILFATAAAATAAVAMPSTATAGVVLSDGHLDYAARVVDGALRSQVKDGTSSTVVWREPADVVVALSSRAKAAVPAKPPTPGIGMSGAPVWLISQVQQGGVPWLGWNTESLTPAELSGPVRWSLDAVSGPGTVTVFQTGSFGSADVLFDSSDGLPDHRDVPLGVHAHGNWTFAARGRYALTFSMRATATDGRAVADTQTLTVAVEEPADGTASPQPPPPTGQRPAPAPAAGDGPAPKPAQGSTPAAPGEVLKVRSLSLVGRSLNVRLQLAATSRVRVKVRRGSRTVASSKTVTVGAKRARATLRLSRKLARGTYTVRVTATPSAGGAAVTRSRTLKVR